MARSDKIKEFYENSTPTAEHIAELEGMLEDRDHYINLVNRVFGMLAHLGVSSYEEADRAWLQQALGQELYERFYGILRYANMVGYKEDEDLYAFNGGAVAMIEGNRKRFEAYEQENGLTNPWARKE